MPADAPTIVATSGGLRPGREGGRRLDVGPLLRHAVDLSGVHGRAPRVCHLGTASGDQRWYAAEFDEALRAAGMVPSHLNLFPMPSQQDPEGRLGEVDVVWVGGGSVANLLVLWRLHDLDTVLRRIWQRGVVLAGVSAGSICWHVGGPTDSFGLPLRAVTDGLALVPWGNGVHYDSETERRPLLHRLVGDGTLPTSFCTDDGAGLVYRGTQLPEAVSEVRGARAYVVTADDGRVVEKPLPTRLLPG
jgi:peptidase E